MFLSRPTKIWLGVFSVWILLVTGFASHWTRSPGLIQFLRLKVLHQEKLNSLNAFERETARLTAVKTALERDTVTQEATVRTVLGYARRDEIIFDFTPNE